jgi:hypothetical protein
MQIRTGGMQDLGICVPSVEAIFSLISALTAATELVTSLTMKNG